MTRLFIPSLGTELTLARDWTFTLYNEHRNQTLITALGVAYPEQRDYYKRQDQNEQVTLPAGAVLKVDRIFIRKGAATYDSVTFCLKASVKSPVVAMGKSIRGSVRFWVKLADANNLEFVEQP